MKNLDHPLWVSQFKDSVINQKPFDFDEIALRIFEYQSQHNSVYRDYLRLLNFVKPVKSVDDIPHLPISLFKNFKVVTGNWQETMIFKSSATTNKGRSLHYVDNLLWYQEVAVQIFEQHFGSIEGKLITALLPGYLDRGESSLIYMVNHFMQQSQHPANGFFPEQYQALQYVIENALDEPVFLFAVPWALLDFIQFTGPRIYPHLTIIETGGMKGRGIETTKTALHEKIVAGLQPAAVFSEYGMTELLSQAYTDGGTRFIPPTTMRITIRELNDPFGRQKTGKPGAINITDLANIQSCAFIETEDMGIKHHDGSFEVLGRIDNREIRGCNLLA